MVIPGSKEASSPWNCGFIPWNKQERLPLGLGALLCKRLMVLGEQPRLSGLGSGDCGRIWVPGPLWHLLAARDCYLTHLSLSLLICHVKMIFLLLVIGMSQEGGQVPVDCCGTWLPVSLLRCCGSLSGPVWCRCRD